MHDSFRDPLMVEVLDLLPENEVLQERRPAAATLQRILVVADRHAVIGGQSGCRVCRGLMKPPPAPGLDFLTPGMRKALPWQRLWPSESQGEEHRLSAIVPRYGGG